MTRNEIQLYHHIVERLGVEYERHRMPTIDWHRDQIARHDLSDHLFKQIIGVHNNDYVN